MPKKRILFRADGLAGHLFSGLESKGVPENLSNTVFPFLYNKLNELEELLVRHLDIGIIKMEVSRNEGPVSGFLEGGAEISYRKWNSIDF